MRTFIVAALFSLFVLSGLALGQSNYARDTAKWRTVHENELKAEDGWLSVIGLNWLKEGGNTIGWGRGFDVQLSEGAPRKKFGDIALDRGKGMLLVDPDVTATINGRSIKTAELTPDPKAEAQIVKVGSESFFLIKRGERVAVRIRDSKSKARRQFTHLKWFAYDPNARVVARFEKYAAPREVLVPNVLGESFKMTSPGLLRFRYGGHEYALEPVEEDGKLFIIFRDATSKTETYGAGRFLYAGAAVNGKVVLDFNRAENPPCAFTAFATCPLPPKQNRIDAAIRAGEKRFHP
jgi:uncharacterized protein